MRTARSRLLARISLDSLAAGANVLVSHEPCKHLPVFLCVKAPKLWMRSGFPSRPTGSMTSSVEALGRSDFAWPDGETSRNALQFGRNLGPQPREALLPRRALRSNCSSTPSCCTQCAGEQYRPRPVTGFVPGTSCEGLDCVAPRVVEERGPPHVTLSHRTAAEFSVSCERGTRTRYWQHRPGSRRESPALRTTGREQKSHDRRGAARTPQRRETP